MGRLVRTAYPDEKSYEIAYDEASNPTQIKDPNGTLIKNQFDLLNKLIRRDIEKSQGVEGTTFESFAYNSLEESFNLKMMIL